LLEETAIFIRHGLLGEIANFKRICLTNCPFNQNNSNKADSFVPQNEMIHSSIISVKSIAGRNFIRHGLLEDIAIFINDVVQQIFYSIKTIQANQFFSFQKNKMIHLNKYKNDPFFFRR
jgi:hypothetical protein